MNYSSFKSSTNQKLIELVFIHELNFFGVLSLWKLFKRCGPAKVFYLRRTQSGEKLLKLFIFFRILKEEPSEIDDWLLLDTPDCRYWKNAAQSLEIKKTSPEIEKIINLILPKEPDEFKKFLTYNIIKSWQRPMREIMHLCDLAQVMANQKNLPIKKTVIFSSFTPLFIYSGLKEEFSGFNLQEYFEIRFLNYNLGALFVNLRCFFDSIFKINFPYTKQGSKLESARFGVEAAWGTEGIDGGRMDDLFWWRKSSLPGNRISYIYDRGDTHPKPSEVESLKSQGIQSIVTNSNFARDWPQLYFNPSQGKSLSLLFSDFFRTLKLTFKSMSKKTLENRLISQINWRLCKSNRLVAIFNSLNIKGVFHHDENGFDDVTLACKLAGGARIVTHWSCFNGVSDVNRSHDVFFIWGKHDAQINLDSGSVSKHLLISGCILTENSKKEAYKKAKVAAKTMKNGGVKYILSIFDSGISTPNFNRFFLRWILEDPCLGIFIKPKTDNFTKRMDSDLRMLFDQAFKTGRIHLFDNYASPADAAKVSDFSVGLGNFSAIVVSALQGARILYMDYEEPDQGLQKPKSPLHSLGEKRCVFYNLDSIKQAVLEYYENPATNPYLGDVSPVLDNFDHFRDGKASERIGEYISWYLNGLDNNLGNDIALQKATQKYAAKWGEEIVIRGTRA